MARNRAGFTLIEILVVVVIIAILAAILLPILGSAREHSHRTHCMTNLHQISVALKQYRLDQGGYPPDLSEVPIDTAQQYRWFGSQDPTTFLPDQKRPGYGLASLYPDYVESYRSFACPDNDVDSIVDKGEPTGDVTVASVAPCYQSYDGVDPLLHSGAKATTERLRYRRYWRDPPTGTNPPPDPDYRRQLSWKYPPEDAVVTWCIHHRYINDVSDPRAADVTVQKKSIDIVLFLDGTTRVLPSVEQSGHTALPGDGR